MASESAQLQRFCTFCVPDFTPLGGSRPDSAVVACAFTSLYMDELREDVILPPDVLDTALATLCAPLLVAHGGDLQDVEAHFRCPSVSVRLRTMDTDVLAELLDYEAQQWTLSNASGDSFS